MKGRRGGYGCDGIYWQDGVAVVAVGAWQPQKTVGWPSGGLWLNDKGIHETHCETQNSADLMYPAMVSGLPVPRQITSEFCSFEGNLSSVLSKWVKNGKRLTWPTGKACWERAGNEGGSFMSLDSCKGLFNTVFYSGPPVSKRSAGTGKRERMAVRVVSLQSTSIWRTNNKEVFSLEEDILGREKGYG